MIPGILDISIPNYFMRGSGTSSHFQYEVCIVTTVERWTVLRRYQRFRDLHNVMRKKYGGKVGMKFIRCFCNNKFLERRFFHKPIKMKIHSFQVSSIPFPPKKFFGRFSESLAKERQKLLEVKIQKLQ